MYWAGGWRRCDDWKTQKTNASKRHTGESVCTTQVRHTDVIRSVMQTDETVGCYTLRMLWSILELSSLPQQNLRSLLSSPENKRERIKTSTQCAEWPHFVVNYFSHNLTYRVVYSHFRSSKISHKKTNSTALLGWIDSDWTQKREMGLHRSSSLLENIYPFYTRFG